METHYTPEQQRQGRRWWMAFSFMNSFAFQFLAGNVVLLFIIGLGASKTLVGFVSSFFHLSYFIMPVGRMLSRKVGIVRGFTLAWFARYFVILPVVFAPLVVISNPGSGPATAIIMVVIGYLLFQMVRGAGLVSFSPTLTEVSHGEDRGRFLSQSRILTDLAILLGSLSVAFFLGNEAPYIRYFISFALGVGMGFIAVFTISRIPEIARPEGHVDHGLIESVRDILKEEAFRRYFITLIFVGFNLGILRPFILVYVKDVFGFPDNQVLYLTVAGSLGAIAMGFISRKYLDRLGAKPMLIMWIFLMLFSSLVVVFIGEIGGWLVVAYSAFFFFVMNMGIAGAFNTEQTYFFGMIKPEQQLSYGIIYFLITGISGALGSNSAGIFLDVLQGPMGMDPRSSQRVLFGVISLMLVFSLVAAFRMKRLGALSVKQSLSEIFRLRQRTRNQGQ
jgi:predicted MFS family arabinose efflux permease